MKIQLQFTSEILSDIFPNIYIEIELECKASWTNTSLIHYETHLKMVLLNYMLFHANWPIQREENANISKSPSIMLLKEKMCRGAV